MAVLGVDGENQKVEMHVQVEYEGSAENFAWVLPVKGEPDVFLSTSTLFTALPQMMPKFFTIDGDDSACTMFR